MSIATPRALPPPSDAAELSSAVDTVSATLEPIDDGMGNLVRSVFAIAGPARIMATMSLSSFSQAPGSNATGGWAIQINGVNGMEFTRFLSGSNDRMMGSAAMRSAVLPAGTYTINGMHRRVSGTRTIITDQAVLLCWPVAP